MRAAIEPGKRCTPGGVRDMALNVSGVSGRDGGGVEAAEAAQHLVAAPERVLHRDCWSSIMPSRRAKGYSSRSGSAAGSLAIWKPMQACSHASAVCRRRPARPGSRSDPGRRPGSDDAARAGGEARRRVRATASTACRARRATCEDEPALRPRSSTVTASPGGRAARSRRGARRRWSTSTTSPSRSSRRHHGRGVDGGRRRRRRRRGSGRRCRAGCRRTSASRRPRRR